MVIRPRRRTAPSLRSGRPAVAATEKGFGVLQGHFVPVEVRRGAGRGGDHRLEFGRRSDSDDHVVRLGPREGEPKRRLKRVAATFGDEAAHARQRSGLAAQGHRHAVGRQEQQALEEDRAQVHFDAEAGDLFSPQGAAMWERLKKLRDEGLIERVGVSVFASDEPVGLTRRFKPDIIQAPVSLLDQRLIVSGALAEIAGLGVEVHLRSIFLQGLLFLPPDRMPTALRGQAGPLSRVRRLIAEGRSDPLQAALWFALSRPEAHHVIVGVASAAELQAVIAAAASAPPDLDWDEMALEHPEALIGGGGGWAA